jgi:hypothetical protein
MTQAFDPTKLYCVNHPQNETNLRCNRCERPICTRCAVLTPTGYRCRDCVRGQQKTYETAQWMDYPLAIVLAAGLSFLGSLVAGVMGFFALFIAPVAGVIIAEVVRAAVRKRRSRRLFQWATIAAALGSLIPVIQQVILILLVLTTSSGQGGGFSLFGFLPLVFSALYTFLVTSTVYYRLAGIQLKF